MDCAFCRKSIKKGAMKCIPCDKVFHPGCIGLHKVLDATGHLTLCKGESAKIPSSPIDIFVDASSAIPPKLDVTTVTTTTTTTTTVATTIASTASVPLATARSSYCSSSAILPPAPTTDLSQLCADVRAVLHSQCDLKTILQTHTVKLNQCTEFICSQKVHNESMENALASLTADINSKCNSLTQNYVAVSSRVSALEESFAKMKSQFNEFKSSTIESHSSVLTSETVREMSVRIQKLEQEQTTCDVLVSGLPETSGENLPLSIVKIAEVLEVPLSVHEIVSIKRLPSKLARSQGSESTRSKQRTILLRLSTLSAKKMLLSAKRHKVRLSAKEIASTFPDTIIGINDFLPKDSWSLLRTARAAARDKGYRFCWYSNGNVLVKKDAVSRPVRISCERDIETKMP